MPRNLEDHSRGFKEVSIIVTQVQEGSRRFPPDDLTTLPPTLSRWRNNLTGLSKVHNFYYVAYADAIHVYQPGFLDQSLPSKPDLIINPPVSAPGLHGHIDGLCPHSINDLLVDCLGSEEIVLVCCDDGDVIAYHTHAIYTAIERRKESDLEIVDDDPRPFFHENVQDSAWGLSVHKEARMIAVSANTCKVTVFALALASNVTPGDSPPDKLEYQMEIETPTLDAVEDDPQDFPTPRAKSHRITLEGLESNIPSVAFCNTGDDPTGRWILATDISGTTCLWDIHQRRVVRLFRTGFCSGRFSTGPANCTCEVGPFVHSGWGVMWLDRRSFHKTKTWEEAGGLQESTNQSELSRKYLSLEEGIWDISSSRREVRKSSAWYGLTYEEGLSRCGEVSLPESKKPFYGAADKWAASEIGSALPACPLLLITKEDVMLLQPQRSTPTSISSIPVVAFQNPLFQNLPGGLYLLEKYDRLNLYTQIPELGVVIVGSGKGRVAIFSLAQPNTAPNVIYAFRLDYVLPFTEQEIAAKRPRAPLVGVAAGPVQGMLGQQARARKWRLMLMYVDHSVLSYELGRPRDGTEGVQALIV